MEKFQKKQLLLYVLPACCVFIIAFAVIIGILISERSERVKSACFIMEKNLQAVMTDASNQYEFLQLQKDEDKSLKAIAQHASREFFSKDCFMAAIDKEGNVLASCGVFEEEVDENRPFPDQNSIQNMLKPLPLVYSGFFSCKLGKEKYVGYYSFHYQWNCFMVRAAKLKTIQKRIDIDGNAKKSFSAEADEYLQKLIAHYADESELEKMKAEYEQRIESLNRQLQSERTAALQQLDETTGTLSGKYDRLIELYDPDFDDSKASALVVDLAKMSRPVPSKALQGGALMSRTDLTEQEKEIIRSMQQTLKSFDYISSFVANMPQKKSLIPYVNAMITAAHQIANYAEQIAENDANKNKTIRIAEKKISESDEDYKKAAQDLSSKESQIMGLTKSNSELQNTVKKLSSDLAVQKKDVQAKSVEITKLSSELKNTKTSLQKTQKELEEKKKVENYLSTVTKGTANVGFIVDASKMSDIIVYVLPQCRSNVDGKEFSLISGSNGTILGTVKLVKRSEGFRAVPVSLPQNVSMKVNDRFVVVASK